jgi:hypothetical protein
MYTSGLGVAKNDEEAVSWYRKAAEQGLPEAQFELGTLYSVGRGVTRDSAEAIFWYRRAAAQGHPDAQQQLERLNATRAARSAA